MTNQNTTDDGSPGGALVVRRPTRAEALRAGVLVDLTPWARVAGFVWPVACTAALWHGCVVPPDDPVPVGQSARGRAHGLLWVLREEVRGRRRAAAPPTDRLTFGVLFVAASGRPAGRGPGAGCRRPRRRRRAGPHPDARRRGVAAAVAAPPRHPRRSRPLGPPPPRTRRRR